MGGKKKTKWRKLPLEEFTKDCSKFQRRRSSDESKSDTKIREENESHIPIPEDAEDNPLQISTEYNENPEGVWFPTHYLIYNPIEVPMYPNYVMPSDSNYYYYPSSEINPVQDYASAPYQEYVAPVKDTVYLLFPASALRPPQASPYDWRNRRRRRRYGGYAEYAVIPEKTNVEEKYKENKTINTPLDKISNSSSQFEEPTVEKEITSLNETVPNPMEEPDIVKVHIKFGNKCELKNNMGLSNDEKSEVPSNKPKKSVDVCGVHSKNSEKPGTGNNLKAQEESIPVNCSLNIANGTIKLKQQEAKSTSELPVENMQACVAPESVKNDSCLEENQNGAKSIKHSSSKHTNDESEVMSSDLNMHSTEEKLETENIVRNNTKIEELSIVVDAKSGLLSNPENASVPDTTNTNLESDQINSNQTSMPDILNTLNNVTVSRDIQTTVNANIPNNGSIRNFTPIHKSSHVNESFSKSTPVISQSSYVPYLFNSDTLGCDIEFACKQPHKSQSMQANNSIYKLAYDENITDQSDSSRSPSPIDPESQMPSSLVNHEINVYEADSGDEAGSEDLELIPHRYESESFLNKSKHVYENRLSLAVELLRTKESLPYDSQFKRVTDDNNQEYIKQESVSSGEVNLGFRDDSNFLDSFEMESKCFAGKPNHMVITDQCQTHAYPGQNATTFEIPLENSFTDSCEIADEVVTQAENHQENTEEVRAGYRRFGVQFRHYFSPKSALVSPWNCCNVM